MNGSPRERSPGHWEVRVYAGRDPVTGRDRYRSSTVRGSKRDAQRVMASLVTEVNEGKQTGTTATVAVLMKRWLEHTSRDASPTTFRESVRIVEDVMVPAVGHVELRRLGPEDLDRLFRRVVAEHNPTAWGTGGGLGSVSRSVSAAS